MSRQSLIVVIICIIVFFYVVFDNMALRHRNEALREALTDTETQFASTTGELSLLISSLQKDLDMTRGESEAKDTQLQDTITILQSVHGNLENAEKELAIEKGKIGGLSEQISSITNVVGELTKLSETDKELLQKYSKVYFLNEHYVPKELLPISTTYTYSREREYYIHANVFPFLHTMLDDARDDGVMLGIISAYRSFDEQEDVKVGYTVTYGEGANTFSADQGYSEHQLGTAIDFMDTQSGKMFAGFEKTNAYAWLQAHAYRYGFIESYPKGNTYYIYEPWHWRFVGVVLALRLHNNGEYFYDVDQRLINDYLSTIFDTPPAL